MTGKEAATREVGEHHKETVKEANKERISEEKNIFFSPDDISFY